MWTYRAPVADMLHLMTQVLDVSRSWSALPAFDGLDADTARGVLEQAGGFASEVLATLPDETLRAAVADTLRHRIAGAETVEEAQR